MANPWDQDPAIEEEGAASQPWASDPASTSPEQDQINPIIGALNAFSHGGNVGLAQFLGAPTDLVNAALQQAGFGVEEPFMGSSYLRGKLAKHGMGYSDIGEVQEKFRPFARAGEVTGQSLPIAAAPLAAVRAGAQGPKLLQPILEAARTHPGSFLATEAGGIAGAAIGGGVAESVAPGDPLVAAGAETAGGIVSPIAVVTRGLKGASKIGGRAATYFSKSAQEYRAGKAVSNVLQEAGEDPQQVIAALKSPSNIRGTSLTSGQKSGSPGLIALEQKFAREIPGLKNKVRSDMEQTTLALNRAYEDAIEAGDSTAIRDLAKERVRWFASLVGARVRAAEQLAERTATRIRPRTSPDENSRRAREALQEALTDARAGERAIWAPVPDDIEIQPSNLANTFASARSNLLDEESLPAPVEAFMRRVQRAMPTEETPQGGVGLEGEAQAWMARRAAEGTPEEVPEVITSGDLKRFRSRLLALQRNIRSSQNPDWTVHRALGNLADSVLDDMVDVPGVDEARAFSRQLNNLFSRGTVGRLLNYEGSGGVRVEPEMTLQKGMGQGKAQGAIGSREIEQAARTEGLQGVQSRSTIAEQEDFIRNLAQQAVDAGTGQVNPKALSKFRRDNQTLLERFPDLAEHIQDADHAQRYFDMVVDVRDRALNAVEQRSAFAKMAGDANPERVIGQVLRGKDPVKHYKELARLAQRGGEDSVAGLRRATFDYLFGRAMKGELVSGQEMQQLLKSRPAPGDPTLLEVMVKNGVISETQRGNLMTVVNETARIEDALETGHVIGDILDDATALEDTLTRIIGANIGGHGAIGSSTGTPLVAAQAGSRFARRLMQQIPAARTSNLIAEALENPDLMAAILQRGRTARQQRNMERQINAFLLQTAMFPDKEEENR